NLGFGSTSDRLSGTQDRFTRGLEEHEIPCSTFDALVERFFRDDPIDICKMDIEGTESDLLVLAPETCVRLQQARFLFMETHRVDTYRELRNRLDSLGFVLIAKERGKVLGVHAFRNAREGIASLSANT